MKNFEIIQHKIASIEIHTTGLQYKQFLNELQKTTNIYDAIITIDNWYNWAIN